MEKKEGAHLLFVHCFLLSAREGDELELEKRCKTAETALYELLRNKFLVYHLACLSDQLHVIVKLDPPQCVAEIDKCLRAAIADISGDFWDTNYGAATLSEWDIPKLSRFIKRLDKYSVSDRDMMMNRVIRVELPDQGEEIRN